MQDQNWVFYAHYWIVVSELSILDFWTSVLVCYTILEVFGIQPSVVFKGFLSHIVPHLKLQVD